MTWFYTIPDWITLPLFTIVVVAASLGLVLLVRPFVMRAVEDGEAWNRVLTYTGGAFGVMFGILLALVAVSVSENYTWAHSAALDETSQLGAIYRGATGLPGGLADELRASVRDYVNTVVDDEWPDQSEGRIPTGGREKVDAMEELLYGFEPQTLQDHAKFSQLLSTFDDFVEARRVRIDATTLALPGQFWFVIWVGAAINAMLISLVEVKHRRLHLLLAGLLAVFVALVIFITADMDHPYSGSISVGPDDFERLLEVVSP